MVAHNHTRHSKGIFSTEWPDTTIQCCPCFKVTVASWLPRWASLLRYHPSSRDSLIYVRSWWRCISFPLWLWCSLCSRRLCVVFEMFFFHLSSNLMHADAKQLEILIILIRISLVDVSWNVQHSTCFGIWSDKSGGKKELRRPTWSRNVNIFYI